MDEEGNRIVNNMTYMAYLYKENGYYCAGPDVRSLRNQTYYVVVQVVHV